MKSAADIKCKVDFKTPQTLKSGAKTLSRPSQDIESDGNNDDDMRVPPTSAREKIKEIMAGRRGAKPNKMMRLTNMCLKGWLVKATN